ncbi:uncharacterized protein N7529_005901 [Penicillium soppii]|jgi:hypothetical protein|uniref:uncharacterized protein n=1 Tax=Penicillium soppii TaxID=69789 RepID=UPI002549B6E9|nr:uncharacterized protein N7529_005901 [Penicillium soppii]KAJ5863985.1 hypothetical protein N7529_005901 [Penicillium soppii]
MGRDQEIISLSSFGRDLVASGRMEFLNGPKFFTKETKATRRKDLTVAPNESPRPVATSKWTSWSALALATTTTDLEGPEQLIVGGGAVTNVSLVMGSQDGLYFSDLKVMPVPVEGATSSGGSLLVAPVAEQGRAQPMFLLPTDGDSDISFTKHNPSVSFTDLSKELKESEGEIGVAAIDSYVLSGDIKNFFGIQGLTGKLYAFKSDEDKKSKNGGQEKGNKKAGKDATKGKKDPQQTTDNLAKQREEMNLKAKDPKEGKTGGKSEKDKEDKDDKEKPVDEKVLLKDMESPLGIIFPEIENKTIRKLPLKNLEFVFSNTEKESLFPAGLRLQGDLELKDDLEFISHRLKDLFGSDKSTTLPKKIRVTALIAKERDWSKKPKIEGIVLQAALDDMKLPAWDFLEFQTVGIELSARKEAIKKDEVEKKKDYKTGSSKKETEETEPKLEAVKDVVEDDASHTGSKVKVEEVAAEATDVEPTKEKVLHYEKAMRSEPLDLMPRYRTGSFRCYPSESR